VANTFQTNAAGCLYKHRNGVVPLDSQWVLGMGVRRYPGSQSRIGLRCTVAPASWSRSAPQSRSVVWCIAVTWPGAS